MVNMLKLYIVVREIINNWTSDSDIHRVKFFREILCDFLLCTNEV